MSNDSKTMELQIRVAAQEAARTVTSLKGEIQTLAVEAGKFAKTDGAALNKAFKDAETAAKDTVSGIGGIKQAIVSLAEVAAAAKALSFIKDLGTFALQTADNFQTARNQFGVLLGDMEAGAGLFNEIKAFNDKTPFDLDTLTQTTNVLIAAKVPLQDLQAQLTKFGDLSQGNSQKLTSYVNAFSQAAAKGKADMQVLNTYLHQGVPILDALAKNFGVTTAEIVKMSSEGEISFADFSKALEDLTAAGGQYFGGMELASQSLAAMQEGLKEATNSLAASFGEMLLPVAVAIVGALTDITNAINESPLLKGLLMGAIVALTGYLAAMAVKATVAFAAQMSLNFAIGATNPVVLAATIAAAGLAAGYTMMAADTQKAARAEENFELALRKKSGALNDAAAAARNYAEAFSAMSGEDIARKIISAEAKINRLSSEIKEQQEFMEQEKNRMREYFENEEELDSYLHEIHGFDKIEIWINNQRRLLQAAAADLNALRQGYKDLQTGKYNDDPPIDDAAKKAAEAAKKWREEWAEQYKRFQAEQSGNPFAMMEIEFDLKLTEAQTHGANREIIDQINEYYAAERSKIIKQIKDEEERLVSSLTETKIDDLQYQLTKELEAIDELEKKKIFSAAYTEEEIADIRKRYADMRKATELKFSIEIDQTELEEARAAIKNWQDELSDSLLAALMNIKDFSSQAAVILSDLGAQFADLAASAALSGFEEFGRALGEGEDAAESMRRALVAMAEQILNQLPTMFLQAGLQLIAQGQWALGLGFIAAAGSTAIIAGYVDGAKSKHAQGGVFDEYGQAARAYADGGAFTNQIVSAPTYFRHGGGLGLMGEAGPEAIMPLTRMSNGDLGVQTDGGGAQVTVNIINNTSAEVSQEEYEDAMGNKQIDVIIGDLVNRHIASGKADRAMGARYGARAQGV